MIKLPEQASCNIIFLLQIDDNLHSILKAELSAEMEKTERDLKRELSTDFLRWALVGVIGIDETFRFKGVQEKHKVKSLKKMEGGLLCIGVCCLPVEDYSVSYHFSFLALILLRPLSRGLFHIELTWFKLANRAVEYIMNEGTLKWGGSETKRLLDKSFFRNCRCRSFLCKFSKL